MKKSQSLILLFMIFLAGTTWAQESIGSSLLERMIIIKLMKAEEFYKEGYLAYQAKDFDKAIQCFKKTLALNPNLVKAHYNLGLTYIEKNLNSAASDHLYKAGLLSLEQGDRDSALKAYNALKLTKSKELEQAFSAKLFPELKQKKSEQSE
jgi:tetratricopeptide (TPR) repeat protein